MKVVIRLAVLTVLCFLVAQLSVTTAQLATMREVVNKVWDKANHRLMTTPWVGAQQAFETETTIFNDVWDKPNNMLRVSGGGSGGGDLSSNTSVSVDSEVAVFSGTTGKTVKRGIGTGVAHLTSGVLSASSVNLATESVGNLSVTQLASGTGATPTTFWRGDGSWATPAGSGGHVIQNEGTALTARAALNFTGAGVDCVDNAGASRTDCTIAAVASSAGIPVFNVKDYGATGNGTTNDTTAIQAAFTAAGNNSIVYFPSGTYSTFLLSFTGKSGLTVRGQGHSSVLKRRDDGGTNSGGVLVIDDSFNVTVEYLGIDLNNCVHYCPGIGINHSTNFRVQFNRVVDSNINTANADDKFGILVQGGGVGNQIDTPSYVLYNILEDVQLEIDRVSNLLVQGNKVIRPRFTAGIGVFTNSVGIPSRSVNVMIVDNVVQDADVSGGAITVHIDPNNQTDFEYGDYVIARNVILYNAASTGEERNGIKVGTGNTSTGTSGNVFRDFQISDNHIWTNPSTYTPGAFFGINLASGPSPNFVFNRFALEGNNIVLPSSAAYGFNLRMLENTVIRGNRVQNVVNSGSGGVSFVRAKHLRMSDNEVFGSAGIGFDFTPVSAYDVDVMSWGNTTVGVTIPFNLNAGPTAEYQLQDFTSAGVLQSLAAASDTIVPWAGVMRVDLAGASASLTMTSTPTFSPGKDGEKFVLMNIDSLYAVTLKDDRFATGTKLFLRDRTVTIGSLEAVSFLYSVALGGWVQDGDGAKSPAKVVQIGTVGDITINSNVTDIASGAIDSAGVIFRNPSGSPVDGQVLLIRVLSSTGASIAWGALFAGNSGLALPTVSATTGQTEYFRFMWNDGTGKWDYIGR